MYICGTFVQNKLSCFNPVFYHAIKRYCSKTHYEVLGISKDATPAEIKAAFVEKSKKVHPDLNKKDPKTHEKFVRLNEAYSVLSKESTRDEYDCNMNSSYTYSPHNPYGYNQYYTQQSKSKSRFRDYDHGYEYWARRIYEHERFREEYYRNNKHNAESKTKSLQLLLFIFVFTVGGAYVQYYIIKLAAIRNRENMNQALKDDNLRYVAPVRRDNGRNMNEEQIEWVSKKLKDSDRRKKKRKVEENDEKSEELTDNITSLDTAPLTSV